MLTTSNDIRHHLTKFSHGGYDFTYKDARKDAYRYRCSHHRAGCKAIAAILKLTGEISFGIKQHSCQTKEVGSVAVVDATKEFVENAREMALSRPCLSTRAIWATVNSQIDQRYTEAGVRVVKPATSAVMAEIANVRRDNSAGNMFDNVFRPEHRFLSMDDKRRFLQVAMRYSLPSDSFDSKSRQLLLWSHPELLPMLRRNKTRLLIDGTFYCVSRPFIQTIIVMLFDDETDLFVPILYAWVDSKNQWTYWHVLHFLIVLTETKIDLLSITSDFELALIKAIGEQFPQSARLGCAFHFKQALRRRLQELGMPLALIANAMRPGMLDSLQHVTRLQFNDAINRLNQLLKRDGETVKWDLFFDYFKRTWVNGHIPFEMWNTTEYDDELLSRLVSTNNALENFNRQLNSFFASPHPNRFLFIETIRHISVTKVAEIKDIKEYGGARPSRREQ